MTVKKVHLPSPSLVELTLKKYAQILLVYTQISIFVVIKKSLKIKVWKSSIPLGCKNNIFTPNIHDPPDQYIKWLLQKGIFEVATHSL